jgi:phage shock protein E
METILKLLKNPGTVVVDVRSPAEFADGHAAGSINIPINELPMRLDELKQMENIVLCCASGIRSQKASVLLKQHQVPCTDGGTWLNINNYLNN